MDSGEDRLQKLWRLMQGRAPEGCKGAGATEQEIRRCEERIGVTLPSSYRRFLAELGFAWWPDEILGLLPGGNLQGPSVIRNTEFERSNAGLHLPHHLVPFHPDGWGNLYCLDTSRMTKGECPVVFWNHDDGEDQQPERTHDSFLHWLEEMVQSELEDDVSAEGARPT